MKFIDDRRYATLIIVFLIVLSFVVSFLILSFGNEDPPPSPATATNPAIGANLDHANNDLTVVTTDGPTGSPANSAVDGNANVNSGVSKPQKGAASFPELRSKVIRDGFKVIADNSQTLIGWCLAIFGATILALISTSYARPPSKRIRLIYLLFIPGWVFIGFSVYCGNLLARYYMVAVQKSAASELELLQSLYRSGWYLDFAYDKQLVFLQLGLMAFAIWILAFLVWWVFSNGEIEIVSEESKT